MTIIIVTWNSLKFLSFCLKSIFKQTFTDFSVIVVDNASQDKTVEFIKENYPQVTILRNTRNLGFAHANNQGIQLSKSPYILFSNPDIILEPDFLEKAIKSIEKEEKIASVGGKLLKLKADFSLDQLPEIKKTDIIDSCGLEIFKSGKVIEWGMGERDSEKYSKEKEIFGVSGALVLYKKEVLEDLALAISFRDKTHLEYFDEDFFAYKEDVDLAWRARLYGYKAVFNPKARAYHFRSVDQFRRRKERPKLINILSYKNHLLTLVKNLTVTQFFLFWPFIIFYELKKFFYILFFERSTLLGLVQFFKKFSLAWRKRGIIMTKRRVSDKEVRQWFR